MGSEWTWRWLVIVRPLVNMVIEGYRGGVSALTEGA